MSKSIDFKDRKFNSKTYGVLSYKEMMDCIINYVDSDKKSNYSFIIGTDSTGVNNGKEIEYVTALLIHRIGSGGIYFWHKIPGVGNSLHQRIFQESTLSLEFSNLFMDTLENQEILDFSFEIHVDVGNNGRTKEIISQVVGMIQGNGYKVVTKPEGFVASKVADRHVS